MYCIRFPHFALPLAIAVLFARGARDPGVAQAETVAAPAQTAPARVSEEIRVLDTYPFSEPNPVPVLARDPRLYPYHTFEGYSATSEPREWKVVKLENDLIEVFVLPEVGGKVWGAIVKKTGHEFIYRNEVMKFRNIALRGPWTSGGIEFNFGVIGHTPATATPVDYTFRANEDGSVSCFVGAMDLPSRTHWRVEIRLSPGRADFETRALWYNPTPLEQPYYNWMTAAAFAREDLELFVPGTSYLEHSGRERAWPTDESGRYLPLYRNNAFGGHKSYHVVGELNDFFGGYDHDAGYGWGHWARHEDMPGQKMWLWALSREGGVWEDLLTDTDGQYVEFQAGRLLVQYTPGDPVTGDSVNPITQAGFDPLSASRWTETWFPLERTGGLTDASRDGAMHVRRADGQVRVSVNAFRAVSDTLQVWSDGVPVGSRPVQLGPLEPFEATFEVPEGRPVRVRLPALDLDYDSGAEGRLLARPFHASPEAWGSIPETDRRVFQARELARGRRYGAARKMFEAVLDREPWNRDALLGLAELALRSGRYEDGLGHVNRALQLDTYDPKANFIAGNLYLEVGQVSDARDAFGLSARSVAYRAASYVRLAEVMIAAGEWAEAKRYAELARDFDRHSIPAWQLLALWGRRSASAAAGADGAAPQTRAAAQARAALLEIDPLHHFVFAEAYLADRSPTPARRLLNALRSEYPDQSLLELAVGYANRGLADDALALLELAERSLRGDEMGEPRHPSPVLRAWRAFLAEDPTGLDEPVDLAFAFPFRAETLPVLRWAADASGQWGWTYLLGLNLWALDREEEAARVLASLGTEPDYAPAYAARGHLLRRVEGRDPGPDLSRAVEADPGSRILRVARVRHALGGGRWEEALEASSQAREAFPEDFNLDLLHARGLLNAGRAREAVEILTRVRVLPSENSRESHRLYELAHMAAALDELEAGDPERAVEYLEAGLLWPESLGQGRPYDPEDRLIRYLLGVAQAMAGDPDAARQAFRSVVARTRGRDRDLAWADVPSILALHALGRAGDLAEIAAGPSGGGATDAVRADTALRSLAADLIDPDVRPVEATARLVRDHPEHFAELEGGLFFLGKAVALLGTLPAVGPGGPP